MRRPQEMAAYKSSFAISDDYKNPEGGKVFTVTNPAHLAEIRCCTELIFSKRNF